jgi:hypothetical protein
MTKARVYIKAECFPQEAREGDVLVQLDTPGSSNKSWAGMVVRGDRLLYPTGKDWGPLKHACYPAASQYVFVVDRDVELVTTRPMVQGTAFIGKAVEDWPCTCPRCGTPKSAVLLFSSWDCKRGCYART